jgi:hypothetical protein
MSRYNIVLQASNRGASPTESFSSNNAKSSLSIEEELFKFY